MQRPALDDTREFVLCFDGTGYKFHGDEGDSNVLKIYRVSPSSRRCRHPTYTNTDAGPQ